MLFLYFSAKGAEHWCKVGVKSGGAEMFVGKLLNERGGNYLGKCMVVVKEVIVTEGKEEFFNLKFLYSISIRTNNITL